MMKTVSLTPTIQDPIPTMPFEKRRQDLEELLASNLPRQAFRYGTAGFRCDASLLPPAIVRVALWACLVSRTSNLGIMITASHNPVKDNGVKVADALTGGMIDGKSESELTTIVNLQTLDDVLKEFCLVDAGFDKIVEAQQSPSPVLHVGYDTRPSSMELIELITNVASLCSVKVINHGLVSTPILHHIVWQGTCNKAGNAQCYFIDTVNAYMSLLATKERSQSGDNTSNLPALVVDCACGVGYNAIQQLQTFLHRAHAPLEMNPINGPDDGLLNYECGSDYVQKQQQVPKLYSSNVVSDFAYAASIDGDADRLVFFYRDNDDTYTSILNDDNEICLLDGDKISALFALFIQTELTQLNLQSQLKLGVVQTAYANGSSRKYFSTNKIDTVLTKTGVKHLHHAAVELYDVGIYFEANGHGTVVFSQRFFDMLSAVNTHSPRQTIAAQRLHAVSQLVNPAVGDALADVLLVDAILRLQNWTLHDWQSHMYKDMPSQQSVVRLSDTNHGITTNNDETRCLTPEPLQSALDELMATVPNSRIFIRPSGTEPVVRVYAESPNIQDVDSLSQQARDLVSKFCIKEDNSSGDSSGGGSNSQRSKM